jgi:SPP1 gp7 family putative phage head morphogenesis protein
LSKRFLPDTLQKQLAGRSLTWAGVTNEDLLRTIQTTVMEGLTSGDPSSAAMSARLESVFRGWVADGTIDPTTGDTLTEASKLAAIGRTQASAAYNAGRLDLIMDPQVDVVEAVQYSAILDGRTSEFCRKWDGTVVEKRPENEALIRELNPPNHVHCRSFWVPITEYEEWTETPADERPNVQPQRGFGVVPGEANA